MSIDQPAGTGFSYVKNPLGYMTNEQKIGMEIRLHDQLAKDWHGD